MRWAEGGACLEFLFWMFVGQPLQVGPGVVDDNQTPTTEPTGIAQIYFHRGCQSPRDLLGIAKTILFLVLLGLSPGNFTNGHAVEFGKSPEVSFEGFFTDQR